MKFTPVFPLLFSPGLPRRFLADRRECLVQTCTSALVCALLHRHQHQASGDYTPGLQTGDFSCGWRRISLIETARIRTPLLVRTFFLRYTGPKVEPVLCSSLAPLSTVCSAVRAVLLWWLCLFFCVFRSLSRCFPALLRRLWIDCHPMPMASCCFNPLDTARSWLMDWQPWRSMKVFRWRDERIAHGLCWE